MAPEHLLLPVHSTLSSLPFPVRRKLDEARDYVEQAHPQSLWSVIHFFEAAFEVAAALQVGVCQRFGCRVKEPGCGLIDLLGMPSTRTWPGLLEAVSDCHASTQTPMPSCMRGAANRLRKPVKRPRAYQLEQRLRDREGWYRSRPPEKAPLRQTAWTLVRYRNKRLAHPQGLPPDSYYREFGPLLFNAAIELVEQLQPFDGMRFGVVAEAGEGYELETVGPDGTRVRTALPDPAALGGNVVAGSVLMGEGDLWVPISPFVVRDDGSDFVFLNSIERRAGHSKTRPTEQYVDFRTETGSSVAVSSATRIAASFLRRFASASGATKRRASHVSSQDLEQLQLRIKADGKSTYQAPRGFGRVRSLLENSRDRGCLLVVTGAAGGGKSRLGSELETLGEDPVFFVDAKRLTETTVRDPGSPWDVIEDAFEKQNLGGLDVSALDSGDVVVFVDALDEAYPSALDKRGLYWDHLMRMLRQVALDDSDRRRVVLTCRNNFTQEYLVELAELARHERCESVPMDPLTWTQMRALWTSVNPADEQCDALRKAVRRFVDLCESPRFLLWLAGYLSARAVEGRNELPENRYELLTWLVEKHAWVERVRYPPGRLVSDASDLLLLQQSGEEVLQNTVRPHTPEVRAYLEDRKLDLEGMAESSFFLPGHDGEITTLNRSVTEYLVARALFARAKAGEALLEVEMLARQPPHEEVVRLFGQACRLRLADGRRVAHALATMIANLDRNDKSFRLANLVSLLASVYPKALADHCRDLGGCHLERSVLSGSDLSECSFEGSDLTNSVFYGCNLRGTVFRDSTLKMVYLASPGELRCAAVDVKRGRIACARADTTIRVLDASGRGRQFGGAEVVLRGHRQKVNQVRWLSSDRLLSASNDGQVLLWERYEDDLWAPRVLCTAPGSVESLQVDRQGRWAASGNRGWVACGGDEHDVVMLPPTRRTGQMHFATIFLDDETLLTTRWDGVVQRLGIRRDGFCLDVKDEVQSRPTRWCCAHQSAVRNELVVLAGMDGVWLCSTGRRLEIQPVPGAGGPVRAASFSSEGVLVWSAGSPAELLWMETGDDGLPRGEVGRVVLGIRGWVWSITEGPDRTWLLATSSGELLSVSQDGRAVTDRYRGDDDASFDVEGMVLAGQLGLTAQRVADLCALGAVCDETSRKP